MFRSRSRQGKCRKVISTFILAAFLCSVMPPQAYAAVDMGRVPYEMPVVQPRDLGFAEVDINTFTIPAHLGEVDYAFEGDSDQVVIHLQDAHCNPFAQHKISRIIEYLNNEYGIDIVNLEGGSKDYDLSIFTSISGETIREEVAGHFVKTGEINGAEFYAINNPETVKLWGVEDEDLYLENLKIYHDSLVHKEEVDEYLKTLTHVLNNFKRHIYTQKLLKMDMAYISYKKENKGFKEYLKFLLSEAKNHAIQIRQFANLYLLSQAIEQEEKVDFRKANIERNILVEELKKTLSKNELRELLSRTVDFKTKKLSRKIFYNFLLKKAKEVDINLDRFPALSNYIVYIALYEAVDRYVVMDEVRELEDQIKEMLFLNDEQRALDVLSRNLALTKNIFDILLIKSDYEYYVKNSDSFSIHNYLSFIEKEAPKYKITARPDSGIRALDEYREDIVEFYECSFKRDKAFLRNIKFGRQGSLRTGYEPQIASGGTKIAILMTGGFHTENLCELFEEKGISYVSILPKFTTEESYTSPYFDLLAGQTTDVQRMLSSVIAKAMMMQVASMLTSLGKEVWGEIVVDGFKAAVRLMKLKGSDFIQSIQDIRLGAFGTQVIFYGKDGSILDRIPVEDLTTDQIRIKAPASEEGFYAETEDRNTAATLVETSFMAATKNQNVANAELEKYGVYRAIEEMELGANLVVVTAEISAFSDLNARWEHTLVDEIRDEFGRISHATYDAHTDDMADMGVTGLLTYYSPYGGQWQYIFTVNNKYDKDRFADLLEKMNEINLTETIDKASNIVNDAEFLNVSIGVSDMVDNSTEDMDKFYEVRNKRLLNEVYNIKRQISGEAEQIDPGIKAWVERAGAAEVEEEIRSWISLIEAGPSGMAANVIGKKIVQVQGLDKYFYKRLAIYSRTSDFISDFEKTIDYRAKIIYFRDELAKAVTDSYDLISYAENVEYVREYPNWSGRSIREFLDITIFDRKPPEGIKRVFAHGDRDIDEWIRSARSEGSEIGEMLRDARLPQKLPNFYEKRKEMKTLLEEIESADIVSEDLKNRVERFVAEMIFLTFESEFGTLQGVNVINTLMQRFVEIGQENGEGIVFRLNIDFDFLSKAPKAMGDKIKAEGLRIIRDVFGEKFGSNSSFGGLAAMAQKGAGDESVVVGYVNAKTSEVKAVLSEAIAEINRRLSLIKFDGQLIRYEVPGSAEWAPSVSAGGAILDAADTVKIASEAELLDAKAEVANNHGKNLFRAGIEFYSDEIRESMGKELEAHPFSQGIPDILLPYAIRHPTLAPYFQSPVAEDDLEASAGVNSAKGILDSVKRGLPAAIIIPLSEEQMLMERSHFQNVGNATKRILKSEIGSDITVIYYQRGDTDALYQAYNKLMRDQAFMDNDNALVLAYADNTIAKEVLDGFNALAKVAGIVVEEMEDGQRIDEVFHLMLGVGLIDYKRTGREEVKNRVKDLLRTMVEDPGVLDGVDIEDILKGVLLIKIKRIDYGEIQGWKDAQYAVLTAL